MSTPILATKLYAPPPRAKIVNRPRLIERLDEGLQRKLTLISAPAGFGKTTLVSEWLACCGQRAPEVQTGPEVRSEPMTRLEPMVRLEPRMRAAWLSLDEGDSDPARFLAYLIAALQTIAATIGEGLLAALQSPQPPPTDLLLTSLLNDIAALSNDFTLVLDDYHLIDDRPANASTRRSPSKSINEALTFLVEHLPPQMHLIIASREDPGLPLARLRARGQLTELRAADLRFTPAEAAAFFNQVMGLNLSEEDIAALDARTEGWVAGLQLAALALQGTAQGHPDAAGFIQSFTGSRGPGVHRFVLDYLVEEVLQQQPQSVQTFLLRTSILDRLCGPLCDAVVQDRAAAGQMTASQDTLEYLEHANLFIVPLDGERRWYRYHHLFADLLRQRQKAASSTGDTIHAAELHQRASQWYEDNGLEIEAFQHAAAANDIARAERLIEGQGMPLHFRGAMAPVLDWLGSLPRNALDARPSLWVTYASALMMSGHPSGVEEKIQAAEAILGNVSPDERTRDLFGQMAAMRALVAAARNEVETIIAQSRRALELLRPGNLAVRTITTFTLGVAYQLQGDRAAAGQAFREVISTAQASGNVMFALAAAVSLGGLQEEENQLHLAAETYRHAAQIPGAPAHMIACGPQLGLGRIFYEWNDLDAAEQHGQQSIRVAPLIECDLFIDSSLLLARVKLARGDAASAAAILAKAEQSARQYHYLHRIPEIANIQVLVFLRQGNAAAAEHLAQACEILTGQARVHLAQEHPAAALAVLEALHQQVEAKGRPNERLKVMVLQAVALNANGEKDRAARLLGEALALAEPGGLVRLFVDEGAPAAQTLSDAAGHGMMPRQGTPDYIAKLLAAFAAEERKSEGTPYPYPPPTPPAHSLIEPLSQRELEVLRLIAQGLSNAAISQRLFLALSTVKGHNRIIFDKLQVQSRTEAVARARELGLL